jgi:hypothetical protein
MEVSGYFLATLKLLKFLFLYILFICIFICLCLYLFLVFFLHLHLFLLFSQSFMFLLFSLLRRHSSVSTATSPPADWGLTGEGVFLLQSAQRGFGVHSASYLVHTGDSFIGVKAAAAGS